MSRVQDRDHAAALAALGAPPPETGLESIGLQLRFGVELEFTDCDVAGVQRALAADPRLRGWRCEIEGTCDGELTSPVLRDDPESWAQVEAACAVLRRCGARLDEHTGMHVHVSAEDAGLLDAAAVRRLVDLTAACEDVLFRVATGPGGVHRAVDADYDAAKPLPAAFREACVPGLTLAELLEELPDDRDVMVNLQNLADRHRGPTVEVRLFDGTLDARRVWLAVGLATGLVTAAAEGDGCDLAPRPLGTGAVSGGGLEEARRVADALDLAPALRVELYRAFAAGRWQPAGALREALRAERAAAREAAARRRGASAAAACAELVRRRTGRAASAAERAALERVLGAVRAPVVAAAMEMPAEARPAALQHLAGPGAVRTFGPRWVRMARQALEDAGARLEAIAHLGGFAGDDRDRAWLIAVRDEPMRLRVRVRAAAEDDPLPLPSAALVAAARAWCDRPRDGGEPAQHYAWLLRRALDPWAGVRTVVDGCEAAGALGDGDARRVALALSADRVDLRSLEPRLVAAVTDALRRSLRDGTVRGRRGGAGAARRDVAGARAL